MRTAVYVDVLLVINYIVNLFLILCTTKCLGLRPRRRRMVAAALLGAFCSLTIFLPYLGFFGEIALKLALSASIVRIALPYTGHRNFLRQWAVFFGINILFAGAMIALWMLFSPVWLTYYNGIVYFDVSPFSLLVGTAVAYVALLAGERLARSGRLQGRLCQVQIHLQGRMCEVTGLLDTGNSLAEPFSGYPVVVCSIKELQALLPPRMCEAIRSKVWTQSDLSGLEAPMRLVPYHGIGGGGVLPAFMPDSLTVKSGEDQFAVESVYVAVSLDPIGDSRYSAILNPELVRVKIKSGGAV